MSKEDVRAEFSGVRRKIMADNGWKGFSCARCGHYSKSVHLHHIKEVVYGGTNDPENLIPLCSDCHSEWDYYDGIIPFEEFLVSVPRRCMVLIHRFIKIKNIDILSQSGLLSVCSQMYRAKELMEANAVLESVGWTDAGLMVDQNRVFSKYPYSDELWRKDMLSRLYGETFNKDRVQQARVNQDGNRGTHEVYWEVDGITKPAQVWCAERGITLMTVTKRMANYGLTIKQALTFPRVPNGKTHHPIEYWRECGCFDEEKGGCVI